MGLFVIFCKNLELFLLRKVDKTFSMPKKIVSELMNVREVAGYLGIMKRKSIFLPRQETSLAPG
jgi:hypothetical protein